MYIKLSHARYFSIFKTKGFHLKTRNNAITGERGEQEAAKW
jgi:hypothetical protein